MTDKREEWLDVKNSLPGEDHDVSVLIRKFGRGAGYVRQGWICSETKTWWVFCEGGEQEFLKSMAHTVDYFEITHYADIPERPN